jgi:hypothetical protein
MRGGAPTIDAALLGAAYATIRRIFVGSRVQMEAMARAMAASKMRPVIDHVAAFKDLATELKTFETAGHFGKIAVSLD